LKTLRLLLAASVLGATCGAGFTLPEPAPAATPAATPAAAAPTPKPTWERFRGAYVLKLTAQGFPLEITLNQLLTNDGRSLTVASFPETLPIQLDKLQIENTRTTMRMTLPFGGQLIDVQLLNTDKVKDWNAQRATTGFASIAERLRAAKSAKTLPDEKLLNVDAQVVEVSGADTTGLSLVPAMMLGPAGGQVSRVRVWVAKAHKLPLKAEGYDAAGKSVFSMAATKFEIDPKLEEKELRLTAPANAKVTKITADVTQKDWEKKLQQDIGQAVSAGIAAGPPPPPPAP
jgi:hypothetical protein